MSRPFIITVASEKGGVGKTTIATNLAVYLKALREDLPVTIASFDNHFSVDQMFAIGGRTGGSLVDLLAGVDVDDLVMQGEYGVQFIASDRRLAVQIACPAHLDNLLRKLPLSGVLILDTRPILDDFTRAALLAADLVLVPVKDRASLINTASIKAVLEQQGTAERLWLVPSLVDARARLNAEVRVKDFLVFSAEERDYQVVDTLISKSPKVESLASGFSSRVHPVLTHARQTAVHGQMRALAEFTLARLDQGAPRATGFSALAATAEHQLRRLVQACPVCSQEALLSPGHFFLDLRSRRCGFLHPACLKRVTDHLEGVMLAEPNGSLLIRFAGAGMLGAEPDIVCHLVDAAGQVTVSEQMRSDDRQMLAVLEEMTGRVCDEWQREAVLLELEHRTLNDFSRDEFSSWQLRRGRLFDVLRTL